MEELSTKEEIVKKFKYESSEKSLPTLGWRTEGEWRTGATAPRSWKHGGLILWEARNHGGQRGCQTRYTRQRRRGGVPSLVHSRFPSGFHTGQTQLKAGWHWKLEIDPAKVSPLTAQSWVRPRKAYEVKQGKVWHKKELRVSGERSWGRVHMCKGIQGIQ